MPARSRTGPWRSARPGDLDPLLILAVIGTESSFKPTARSNAGAEGLMQVMTSVHEAKFDAFGGPEAAFDPYANMVVGTDILSYLSLIHI